MLRWGLIAPGRIARRFADAFAVLPEQRLHRVGARDVAKAQAFAAEWGGQASASRHRPSMARGSDWSAVSSSRRSAGMSAVPEGPLSADEALTLAATLAEIGADAEARDLVAAVCLAAHAAAVRRHAA